MGLFNTFRYADGTLYGDQSKSVFSANPFNAVALGTDMFTQTINGVEKVIARPKVRLTWSNPSGNLLGFRIVRNQEGYPENEEDGHIIYETFQSDVWGTPAIPGFNNVLDQGYAEPLLEGKYAYYTIWGLRFEDVAWAPLATAWCLIPQAHGLSTPDGTEIKSSARRFIETFPKVFTTAQQSYLDEVDETSDMFNFFSGFSYSLDETLTYADLLTPDPSGAHINPNMVDLGLSQLGMPKEPTMSLRRKKSLIRNAFDIHRSRGTVTGLNLFARSLTGFNLTTNTNANILLTPQDSTFVGTTGSWKTADTATLTATIETTPYLGEMQAVDTAWTGKLVTTAINTELSLGSSGDKTLMIPLSGLSQVTYSFYVKGATSALDFGITFYDLSGASISTTAGTTAAVTSSWQQMYVNSIVPLGAVWVSLSMTFATIGTYYIDMVSVQQPVDIGVAPYSEARAVNITVVPNKMNYLTNPSFADTGGSTITDWAFAGGITSYSYATPTTLSGVFNGSHMLDVVTDGINPFNLSANTVRTLPSGSMYTFSIYAATETGNDTLNFTVSAYNEEGDEILDGNGNQYSNTIVGMVTPKWTRFSVQTYVPDTAQQVYLHVEVNTGTDPSSGNTLHFDAAQVEAGYAPTDYFDGSYSENGAYWTGTENNSVSVLFRNKTVKMDRLIYEINSYLPLNTPWTIISGVPGAYVLEGAGYSS